MYTDEGTMVVTDHERELERRRILRGLGAVGAVCAVAPLAAACGGAEEPADSGSKDSGAGKETGAAKSPDDKETGGEKDPGTGAVELGPASEVPVGGGKLYREQKIFVTQPKQGDYRAFSAVCKHAGFLVNKVKGDRIVCPKHFSEYDSTTGAPKKGPGGRPISVISALDKKSVKVEGGNLVLA